MSASTSKRTRTASSGTVTVGVLNPGIMSQKSHYTHWNETVADRQHTSNCEPPCGTAVLPRRAAAAPSFELWLLHGARSGMCKGILPRSHTP